MTIKKNSRISANLNHILTCNSWQIADKVGTYLMTARLVDQIEYIETPGANKVSLIFSLSSSNLKRLEKELEKHFAEVEYKIVKV